MDFNNNNNNNNKNGSRDSQYGDWLRVGRSRFQTSSSGKGKILLFSSPVLGPAQPPILCIQGVISPGIKQPGREADHNDVDIYISTPPYVFMA
jgi:hypothetical protein